MLSKLPNLMFVSALHPEKVYIPIVRSELGRIKSVNPVQLWNAKSLMEVSVSGNLTIDNPKQESKLLLSIEITDEGKTIDIRFVFAMFVYQLLKAN